MATTTVFAVRGMTCGHCVRAVESEVAAIPGVITARADLESGRLEVASQVELDPGAVAAAVEEAGYTLTSDDPSAP